MAKQSPVPAPTTADEWSLPYDAIAEEATRGPAFWKPKEGTNLVRILPIRGNDKIFYVSAYQHFIRTPQGPRPIFCARAVDRGPCAVCEIVEALQGGSEADKADAAQIRAKQMFAFAIIDLKEAEKGPQVWSVGVKVMGQVWNTTLALRDSARIDPALKADSRLVNPFHPETGRSWTVMKQMLGGGPRNVDYTVIVGQTPQPLRALPSYDSGWLDAVPPMIAKVITYVEYGEQQRLLHSPAATAAQPIPPAELAAMGHAPLTPDPDRAADVTYCACGAANAATAKFCHNCGDPLSAVEAEADEFALPPVTAAAPVAEPVRPVSGQSLAERMAALRG